MEPNPLKTRLGEDFFKSLPKSPGVYFLLGAGNRLLYVGKAKGLRARLRSYARVHPGNSEERIVELVAHVRAIRWEEHPSEGAALLREGELLRGLRPPYNVAGTDEELYLYIGVRDAKASRPSIDLRLSNWPDFTEPDDARYRVYGAYRNRGRVKRGYAALLRLLHACQIESPRFSYPARISREAPPWQYRARLAPELTRPLGEFLSGRSAKLLKLIFERLLANERVPRFMRPSIQDDIDRARELYEVGPAATHAIRARHGLKSRLVLPEQMAGMVEREARDSVGIG